MPSRRRTRTLRALLLAAAAAAFGAAGAQLALGAEGDAPAGKVTIVAPDGKTRRTLALADLVASYDVRDATYTVRAADGATRQLPVASGISLEALLRAAGLDTARFDYVAVPRPDGATTVLLADQIAKGEGGPPVVWSDAEGVHFLRPSLADNDPNATDHVIVAEGELQVELRIGDPLVARISASKLRAKPGEAITFTAVLITGDLAPGMTFRWYFDGSDYVYGASATHRFRRPGTYHVLLDIVRGQEAVGVPEILEIVIVRPRVARDRARGAGDKQRGEGSDRAASGGGTGGRSGGSGGGGAGTGTGGGAGSGGYTPRSNAPVVTSAPAPAPPRRPRRPKAKPERRQQPQGELVSGTLLASADELPPAGGGAAAANRADDTPGKPLHVPVGVWVALGLAATLALGWTLESRHTLPFWQP